MACLSTRRQPALSQVPLHLPYVKDNFEYSSLIFFISSRETTYVAGWGITKTKFIHGSKIQVKAALVKVMCDDVFH